MGDRDICSDIEERKKKEKKERKSPIGGFFFTYFDIICLGPVRNNALAGHT